MHVVENAVLVGHSSGDRELYLFLDNQTGQLLALQANEGLVLEMGLEGILSYSDGANEIINFEPVQEEVFA